jgi:zinc/manganese transport system permease protein
MSLILSLCCGHAHHQSQAFVGSAIGELPQGSPLLVSLAVLFVALGSAPLGVFLVLRRISLMADALSHGMMPGASLAWAYLGHHLWGMSLAGGACGLGIAWATWGLARRTRLPLESVGAGLMVCATALGTWMMTGSHDQHAHIVSGTLGHMSWASVASMAVIALITHGFLWRFSDQLLLSAFDPAGDPIDQPHQLWIERAFLAVLTLNLMVGFHVLGGLLGLGLLVLPGLITLLAQPTLGDKATLRAMAWGIWGAAWGLVLSWPNIQRVGSSMTLSLGATLMAVWAWRHINWRHMQQTRVR